MKLLRFTRMLLGVPALAVALALLPAAADEPMHYTYSPAPPGAVVENQVVYLAGEAMHGQWRAVVSKQLVGNGAHGEHFYQWYLSIYSIDGTTYRLKYRSPGNGGPLSKVTQASNGVKMWFPVASLHLAGAAELMQPGVQQLVVQSHEFAADCGGGMVSVFRADSSGKVLPAVVLRNGCELSATIVHGAGGGLDSVRLSGPYYGPNAPMCCPTKPKAQATLSYAGGAWTQTPKYYELFVGKFPPQ